MFVEVNYWPEQMPNFQIISHQGIEGILFHFISSQNDSTAHPVTFTRERNFVSRSVPFVWILCFLPVCAKLHLFPVPQVAFIAVTFSIHVGCHLSLPSPWIPASPHQGVASHVAPVQWFLSV